MSDITSNVQPNGAFTGANKAHFQLQFRARSVLALKTGPF